MNLYIDWQIQIKMEGSAKYGKIYTILKLTARKEANERERERERKKEKERERELIDSSCFRYLRSVGETFAVLPFVADRWRECRTLRE